MIVRGFKTAVDAAKYADKIDSLAYCITKDGDQYILIYDEEPDAMRKIIKILENKKIIKFPIDKQ